MSARRCSQHCVNRFQERFDELAYALCIEAGKPIKDCRGEVTRLIDTFRIAAEESVRITGEVQPLDIAPRAKGYQGIWKRVPIGPCSFVSPFNFPLNLAAHKIAPALAVGCPFVMKPAIAHAARRASSSARCWPRPTCPRAPSRSCPPHREGADLFTTDERLKLLSFTGSPEVGWDLKARAGKKKVVLELGGNAAVVVDARRRPRRCGRADHLRRLLPVGPVLHRRAADHHPRRRSTTTLRDTAGGQRRRTLVAGDPQGRRDLHRPDDRREGGASGWTTGSRKRSRAARTLLCGGKREGAMLRGDAAGECRPRRQALSRGGLRARRDPVEVQRLRRGAGRGQRLQVRPAGRHLHPRPLQGAATPGTGWTSAAW